MREWNVHQMIELIFPNQKVWLLYMYYTPRTCSIFVTFNLKCTTRFVFFFNWSVFAAFHVHMITWFFPNINLEMNHHFVFNFDSIACLDLFNNKPKKNKNSLIRFLNDNNFCTNLHYSLFLSFLFKSFRGN